MGTISRQDSDSAIAIPVATDRTRFGNDSATDTPIGLPEWNACDRFSTFCG
jgi:hypothetical protein